MQKKCLKQLNATLIENNDNQGQWPVSNLQCIEAKTSNTGYTYLPLP